MLQRINDLMTELIQCGGNMSVDQFNQLYSLQRELDEVIKVKQRELPCCLMSASRRIETTLEVN
jgi:hypothetical protein